jgi:hypothetical protein
MDKLSLRKYHRSGSIADKHINSLQKLAKSKTLAGGNTTLTSDGLARSENTFLEFFINDQPLSKLLDKFYGKKGSILDNWIGILGWSATRMTDIVKVKRLLGKNISDKEIREMYPAEWSDSEFENYLEKEREELSDPEIIIYCCAECGDYECGGITVQIDKTDEAVVWTIGDDERQLIFKFDKYQYFDVFDKYLRKLKAAG